MITPRLVSLCLVSLFAAAPFGFAAEPVDFVRSVRPILQQHCYRCHGDEKQKSGLRLDIKSEALKGGDSYGPSIVAGDLDDSPLIELVTSEDEDSRMPPEGERLSSDEIQILSEWVKQGASWPDGVEPGRTQGSDGPLVIQTNRQHGCTSHRESPMAAK